MKIAVVFLVVAFSSCFVRPGCARAEDAPVLLQMLGGLICDYKLAQISADQNAAKFLAFLQQVNVMLAKVGCSINNLLGTHVTINLQNAEALADQVANVLFQFMNDKSLINNIRILGCEALADVIANVDKVLV
ncbi:Hypothetical predicted protein [Pelobates cultripes]|uniref:Uncharacterized protein n=1 Tax=Pelobates cultripes TaxID=61616 RepID=A0AAD1VZ72_PELCU|nr:Hypothetical predicted protein [Pelobates cultripes]